MSAPHIKNGATVRIDVHGLSGASLIVARHVERGYYELRFAHNGNTVPGFYHADLMRVA